MPYPLTNKVEAVGRINFRGNIIPDNWGKWLKTPSGKTSGPALMLLSEIVYWYRPCAINKDTSGERTQWGRKFKADMPQKSYGAIADKWGYSAKQMRDAAKILKEIGVAWTETRTIKVSKDLPAIPNVLFWDIDPKILEQITFKLPDSLNGTPCDPEVTRSDAQVTYSDAEVVTPDAQVTPIQEITTKNSTKTTTKEEEGETSSSISDFYTPPPGWQPSLKVKRKDAFRDAYNKMRPENWVACTDIMGKPMENMNDYLGSRSIEESIELLEKAMNYARVTDRIREKRHDIGYLFVNSNLFNFADKFVNLANQRESLEERERELVEDLCSAGYSGDELKNKVASIMSNAAGISEDVYRSMLEKKDVEPEEYALARRNESDLLRKLEVEAYKASSHLPQGQLQETSVNDYLARKLDKDISEIIKLREKNNAEQ